MIRTSALIVGLLVLGGCSSEPHILRASYAMKKDKIVKICIDRTSGGTGDLLNCDFRHSTHTTVILGDGSIDGSGASLNQAWIIGCKTQKLDKDGCYGQTEKDVRTMNAEEFKFKYDHDKAFRDSISSYSFQ